MKPLSALRIIDLSRVLSGPFCTMSLADMGAQVIKVEVPARGDDTRYWGPPFLNGESTYFLSVNRGKKSVTLNIKDPRGKKLLSRLLEKADVLVENFRPGTLDRLGFGYEQLSKTCPRLIYVSISGYGLTGPRSSEPGYDVIIQGESGVMSVSGFPEGPPTKIGISIADILTGMYAFQGILLALHTRGKTGRGTHVDTGLLDCMVSALTYQAGIYFATGNNPQQMGNRHPSLTPYEAFMAQDGFFIVAVGNESLWKQFCEVLELPELTTDSRFSIMGARVKNHEALYGILSHRFLQRPATEWVATLRGAEIPCGHIRNVAEVFADPQLGAREMILTQDHPVAGRVRSLGNPIKMDGVSYTTELPAPCLGQHNREILGRELGLSDAALTTLRQEGVI